MNDFTGTYTTRTGATITVRAVDTGYEVETRNPAREVVSTTRHSYAGVIALVALI